MNTQQTPPAINRSHLVILAFFSVLFFLVYQAGRLLAPFSSALLWAAVLALALNPLYERLVARLKGRRSLAAAIMTCVTTLVVIGPAIALFMVMAAQTMDLYQWVSQLIQSGGLAEAWAKWPGPVFQKLLAAPFLSGIDLKGIAVSGLSAMSSQMASQIGNALKNIVLLVVGMLIMLLSLFFFFRNGDHYYRTLMDILPFPSEHKRSIARKLRDTFFAVIYGVFMIALLQGMMTGLGFALFGVPFSVLWGCLAAVLALLPVGGAALVWIPGAVYLYLKGSVLSTVFLVVWGTVLVSLPDNFLKPLIIGKKANIPSFFLFVAILGGLEVYGFLGILFGPLIVTLLAALLQIYREEYGEQK